MNTERIAGAAAWIFCAAILFLACSAGGETIAALAPEEAKVWEGSGFSREDGAAWKHVGFSPAEAKEWIKAGIPYAQWAEQWRSEGFSPGQAKEWVEKVNVYTAADFVKFGFNTRETLLWIGQGIRSGLRAKEFREAGFTPSEAGQWWKRQFFPEEAKPWRAAGFRVDEAIEWKYGKKRTHYMHGGVKSYSRAVYSAEWARQWRAGGFDPAEAKKCLQYNMSFEEAVRWSQAGIGIEEAFQWKDSGFGPEEARRKKASGLAPVEAEEGRDAGPNKTGDEVLSFQSDILVHSDGTVTVTESIEIQDRPGGIIQGCYKRTFPGQANLRYDEDYVHATAPSFKLLGVFREGAPAPYSIENVSGGGRTVCIDKKNSLLREGIYAFTIIYETDQRVVELYNHDEFFFDVIGPYWEVPVKKASAVVCLPKGADLIFADGYAGPQERKYFTASVEESEDGDRVRYAVTRPLKTGMPFQVSLAFTKGAVRPKFLQRLGIIDRQTGHLLSSAGVFMAGFFIAVLYFIVVWNRVGKDPERLSVTPQYDPPEGISPAMMRYLVTGGKFDRRSVAAMLVRLAQSGSVRINKEGNSYRITRTGESPDMCLPEEQLFYKAIFSHSESLVVGRKQASKELRSMTQPIRLMLRRNYRQYFETHSRYIWRILAISILAAAGGFFLLDRPPYVRNAAPLIVYAGFVFIFLGAVLPLFYRLLKAPTEDGNRILGRIDGFRKFLYVNYAKVHAFNGRPETDAPPFLEKHLSYAVALGIDTEYVLMRAKSLEWYGGKPGSFSPHDFTSSMSLKKGERGILLRLKGRQGTGADR